jgi:polysaccharide biosynthesis transport protein
MSESEPFREGQPAHQTPSNVLAPQGLGRRNVRGAPDAVAFKELFAVFRRHIWLILAVTACTVGAAAFLAFRDPKVYRATATVRFSEGLRALTADIENAAAPLPQRTVDPVLSLSQHLRSRQVVASVVDSLGTRLGTLSPDFALSSLEKLHVDPGAPVDTLMLHFTDREVVARVGDLQAHAPYGELLRLKGVEFAVAARPDSAVQDAMLSVDPREAAIDKVLLAIEVVERQGTDVIDVSYTATDAKMASQIVNAVVRTFQAVNIQSAQEQSRLRAIFLLEQLRQTDSSLAQAQASLGVFRSRQQLANSSDKLASAQTALLALDAQREQLLADRRTYGELPVLLRSPNDSVSGQALRSLAYSPVMALNPVIAKLSEQLIQYQIKFDSLTTGRWRSTATNPDVAQLGGAIGSTKQELLGAVESQLRSLDGRIEALAALRQRSGASMQALPALEAEEMRLEARVEALRTVGDHLRQESQKARLAEAAEVGDMQIMDLASVPYIATWPAGWLKLGLGLLTGLFLGGGGAYLLEAMNTSIRRPDDLEEALQIAGMAIIPRMPTGGQPGRPPRPRFFRGRRNHDGRRVTSSPQGLVTLSHPRSIGTEAFRMLRTSLIWSEWGKRLKTIVITSVAPGEGKTLTAANLGVSFARGGMRVLLVDGDVRRARLHKIFLVPRGPGLTELIKSNGEAGEAAPGSHAAPPVATASAVAVAAKKDFFTFMNGRELHSNGHELHSNIRKTAVEGLFLLPAGVRSRSSETFGEDQVRRLLRELANEFDLVIVDASPVLASADAAILASMADGVLLVVRAGRTGRGAIQHAHQQLVKVGARVVGTVLNDPQGELKHVEDYYYPYEYVEAKD